MSGVIKLLTASIIAYPFWNAVACLVAFIYSRPFLRWACRSMRVLENHGLEDELVRQGARPLRLVLLGSALLPFLLLAPSGMALQLRRPFEVLILFYMLRLATIVFDITFFRWYLAGRRAVALPAIFRSVTLGFIYAVFGLVLLQYAIGVNVLPILATSTVMTAVVGLALQDMLKNLFAGLSLSIDKSFKIADWVTFQPDTLSTTTGQILEIGWRTTRIATLDGNCVILPNASLITSRVVNHSQPSAYCARTVDLPVGRTADLDKVAETLLAAVCAVPLVAEAPKPEVYASSVSADAVVFRLKFWLEDFRQGETISGAVIGTCLRQLDELGSNPDKEPPAKRGG